MDDKESIYQDVTDIKIDFSHRAGYIRVISSSDYIRRHILIHCWTGERIGLDSSTH